LTAPRTQGWGWSYRKFMCYTVGL